MSPRIQTFFPTNDELGMEILKLEQKLLKMNNLITKTRHSDRALYQWPQLSGDAKEAGLTATVLT
eukprot:2169873-Amphidinium_carterae.1